MIESRGYNIIMSKPNSFCTQITVLVKIIFLELKFILRFDIKYDKKRKINNFKLLSTLLATKNDITN